MTAHEATRTLVKSPPEVWAQCSEAAALDRHLNGSFGEIRITRLEPEIAVAWEGEQVRGTVRIEPSAWGTRVTLTAQVEEAEPVVPATEPPRPTPVAAEPVAAAPPPPPEPESPPTPEPELARARETPNPGRPRLWARLTSRFRLAPSSPPPAPEPAAASKPEPPPAPTGAAAEPPEPTTDAAPVSDPTLPSPEPTPLGPDPAEILNAALESLGQAHHRPFSRA